MAHRLVALALLVVSVAACTSEVEPLPTLPGFPSSTITIDDRALTVAVADTPSARGRGLMGVTELGELDGMLFVFEADTDIGFWMKDTLIPLDIGFFAADGAYVAKLSMDPCTTEDCPTYEAGAPYRYAVEAPAGSLGFVGGESVLVIDS
jgi:uncharacterized protein